LTPLETLKERCLEEHNAYGLPGAESRFLTGTNTIFPPPRNHDATSDEEGENGDDIDMPALIQRATATNASDSDDSEDGSDDEDGVILTSESSFDDLREEYTLMILHPRVALFHEDLNNLDSYTGLTHVYAFDEAFPDALIKKIALTWNNSNLGYVAEAS
jgi:hypothetical protein